MDVLTNKAYKQYNYTSRYNNYPYYYNILDSKYVYGITSQLSDASTYQIHIVEKNDTLDTLALEYYNNPTYFWIIADFNRICDPYKPLIVGTQLKIPTISDIAFKE